MDWRGETGTKKDIMEEERIESETMRRRPLLCQLRRQQREKAGFKRPHSCRCLCCCARKLLSLEESKNACAVMSLSHVMFSFCRSCFFFTTDSWINQSIQDGHGPTSSWKDHVAFFGQTSVEMTAAFVGESLSGRGIFHTPFKAITFVTQCKPLTLSFYWQPEMWAGSQVQRGITIVSRQWKLSLITKTTHRHEQSSQRNFLFGSTI